MSSTARRLCVFFSAGGSRYALDAAHVLEIARTNEAGELTLSWFTPTKDLARLLGGDDEPRVAAGVVIDVMPPLALRVGHVDGVFDASVLPRWPVQGRLIPLIAPVISAALEYEGRLVFELDAESAARGLPRQSRPLERHTREAESGLVFLVDGERFAVPLHTVVQAIETGARFNRSPNAGSFLGVAQHRAQLCPIFTVGALGVVLPFAVLFEVQGELVGLAAHAVEGVRHGPALQGATILDVGRMFS